MTESPLHSPVLADVPPNSLAFRHVVDLSRTISDFRVSLQQCGPGDLVREILKFDGTQHRIRDVLVSELLPFVGQYLSAILVPVLVLGDQKTSPRTIATASGLSGRTIRHRLLSAGLPSPAKVLGLVVGCRVAYDTEVRNLSLAVVARAAGFGSEDALRDYLKVRTGLSPTRWRDAGFAKSLELVRSRLFLER
jgi:hypothetical protein